MAHHGPLDEDIFLYKYRVHDYSRECLFFTFDLAEQDHWSEFPRKPKRVDVFDLHGRSNKPRFDIHLFCSQICTQMKRDWSHTNMYVPSTT